jgi:hypothetical protein
MLRISKMETMLLLKLAIEYETVYINQKFQVAILKNSTVIKPVIIFEV